MIRGAREIILFCASENLLERSERAVASPRINLRMKHKVQKALKRFYLLGMGSTEVAVTYRVFISPPLVVVRHFGTGISRDPLSPPMGNFEAAMTSYFSSGHFLASWFVNFSSRSTEDNSPTHNHTLL